MIDALLDLVDCTNGILAWIKSKGSFLPGKRFVKGSLDLLSQRLVQILGVHIPLFHQKLTKWLGRRALLMELKAFFQLGCGDHRIFQKKRTNAVRIDPQGAMDKDPCREIEIPVIILGLHDQLAG